MHDESELRCARCGKLCAKASSLKRHDYYCRSRHTGPPKSRKRCCELCTRSKIRCDATLPACSSCTSRGLVCSYGENAFQNLVQALNVFDEETPLDNPVYGDASFNNTIIPYASELTGSLGSKFDLNNLSTVGLENYLGLSMTAESSPSGLVSPDITTSAVMLSQQEQVLMAQSPISLQWRAPRLMYQRTAKTAQGQMATALLAKIISSFPYMMLRKENFPPFIHARSYDCASDAQELPEILQDCMGLAQMFTSRTAESSNMFWKVVLMEQEKLFAQYKSYSDFELQAAVQAILIYTTMRLADGKQEYDCIEVHLLHSLNMISTYLSLRIGEHELKDDLRYNEKYNWQQWLFQESRRRVVCVARIMNEAFSMDRAVSCRTLEGYALVPLPAKKSIWEAANERQWRAEYDELLKERSIHGLTSKGELVRLQQTTCGIESWKVEWQEWLANQDGFGMMVMLISQLLAP